MLYQDSGQTPEQRASEVTKIFEMFLFHLDYENIRLKMDKSENNLFNSLHISYHINKRMKINFATVKTLFWLRDLKDKYL
jgi:hypothetical protein